MSGFGCAPVLAPAPAPAAEAPIVNDGWFPDIDVAAVRATLRLKDGITPERLRAALVAAIITVGNQLVCWHAEQAALGRAKLADVPAPAIDGKSRLLFLYTRAIGCYAKAELVEAYRDVDLTGAGQRKVEEVEPSIAEARRDGLHAIRDMLGQTRTDVELL